jgi:hypothetical protein
MRIGHIEHLRVHGQYVGVAQGGEDGWTLEPYKQPRLEVLIGQQYPTREAMLSAIDDTLGGDVIAQMEATAAERRDREARSWEAAKQAAMARSFTGEKFDKHRPLKDVAKAIRGDVLAAMVVGDIPPDRYRVTVRQQRYDPRIYVYAWAAHEIRERVEQIANTYNRCVGEPYSSDRWYFRLYVEWPKLQDRGSYEAYEAACQQAQVEAAVWGQAYIAKHQK